MAKILRHFVFVILLLSLSGCTSQGTTLRNTPPAQTPSPSARDIASTTSTAKKPDTPYSSPTPVKLPLSEPGPFFVGKHTYSVKDESRDGREILLSIYYPAIMHVDSDGNPIVSDAEADRSAAPYPLILTGNNSGSYLFKSHLASYGFVMAIVVSPGFSYVAPWNNAVIDGPLDFLFALDQLASDPPQSLAGVLDTDRVGVAGYSSDGLFSLALSGARVNPEYYFSMCAQAPDLDPPLSPYLTQYFCNLSKRWDEFSIQVGADITRTSEGLWQPTTDIRILAAMPMAPDSSWLYGPEGLAAVHIPSMIIAGTDDDLVSYRMTSCYVYEHLVNADRFLISFIGKGHMMVESQEVIDQINHFAVAFFKYYLQGNSEYAGYFSEDFIARYPNLAWGIYEGE
jgi:predicted dienelactone hydrolase